MSVDVFFTALSKRQSMLLLTAVTFGGQDCVNTLDFLSESEAEILRHRATQMLEIPREKRIPLLVQEIKRLINSRRSALTAADPQKLADVLKGERPAVIEVLLRAFPAQLAEAVRGFLPPTRVRFQKDPDVRPEVLNILRWKLEEVLDKAGARRGFFKFSDVLRLTKRDLLTLCDVVGAKVLAPAVAGLPDAERDAFLADLSPDYRQLIGRYSAAAGARKLEEKDAQDVLLLHSGKGSNAAVRSAGVQRVARASLAQSAEFAARLLEKYPGEFGAVLGKWIREERGRAVNRGDGGREQIVLEMEKLEQRGMINKPPPVLPPPKSAPPRNHASGGASGGPSGGRREAPTAPVRENRRDSPPPVKSREHPAVRIATPNPETDSGEDARPSDPKQSRDWVAQRAARRAGLGRSASELPAPPPPAADLPRRDPVAERAARRAGLVGYRAPPPPPVDDGPRRSSAPVGRRPTQDPSPAIPRPSPSTDRLPVPKRPAPGTSVARPPRSRGEMAIPVKPGGGPKGSNDE